MADKPYKYTRTCGMYEMKPGEYGVIVDPDYGDERDLEIVHCMYQSDNMVSLIRPEGFWSSAPNGQGGYTVDILAPDEPILIIGGEVYFSEHIQILLGHKLLKQ